MPKSKTFDRTTKKSKYTAISNKIGFRDSIKSVSQMTYSELINFSGMAKDKNKIEKELQHRQKMLTS